MKFKTFLEQLSQTPRDWEIQTDHMDKLLRPSLIRRPAAMTGAVQCPVSSIENCEVGQYLDVAKSIGLPPCMRSRIVKAADGHPNKLSRTANFIRTKLREACGIAGVK